MLRTARALQEILYFRPEFTFLRAQPCYDLAAKKPRSVAQDVKGRVPLPERTARAKYVRVRAAPVGVHQHVQRLT